jgi:hypothetical protein
MGTTNSIIMCLVFVPCTAFVFWHGGRIILVALRTGKLLARGTVWDRDRRPAFYFFGIGAWAVVFAIMLCSSIASVTTLMRAL